MPTPQLSQLQSPSPQPGQASPPLPATPIHHEARTPQKTSPETNQSNQDSPPMEPSFRDSLYDNDDGHDLSMIAVTAPDQSVMSPPQARRQGRLFHSFPCVFFVLNRASL